MAELRQSFASREEWLSWQQNLEGSASYAGAVVADVRLRGYVEPFTDIRRYPPEIVIREDDLHESISSHELNSRKRALLLQIILELQTRDWLTRRNLRILGAEALSRIALVLRGQFPYYLGTEFLPDEDSRSAYFPIAHMDLQHIDYPKESFDLFTCGDVFEHIPDLDSALEEICRVLKPGGLIITTFPFDPGREKTKIKASIEANGTVINHEPPEYHGNPVDASEGSLVYQLPGWDILPKLVSVGFGDAYFSIVASSHFGIASTSQSGVFVLTAVKRAASHSRRLRPRSISSHLALPDKLCGLIALPRSGTTVLTSVFAVHSEVEAVYEPWNGKIVSEQTDNLLEAIAKAEDLPDLSGKTLFIKETTACAASIPGLRRLFESVPFPVEKHMLMLLRDPEHTFLSEIERRNEWWQDDVSVNQATFDSWAEKSATSLRQMLAFGRSSNGYAILLEDFAEQPENILNRISYRLGLRVEQCQLEYEKHLETRRVRGDLNVSRRPGPIDVNATVSRRAKMAEINQLAVGSAFSPWFVALQRLYTLIHEHGGTMSIKAIPESVCQELFRVDEDDV